MQGMAKEKLGKPKQAGGTKLPVFATSCWLVAAKRKMGNAKCNGQAENQINIKTKNVSPQDACNVSMACHGILKSADLHKML